MLIFLALVSCQPLTEAKTPIIPDVKPPPVEEPEAARPVRMPEGQAIVRECYGGGDRERSTRRMAPPKTAAPTSTASRSAATPPPAPAPMGTGYDASAGPSGAMTAPTTTTASGSGGLGNSGQGGVSADPYGSRGDLDDSSSMAKSSTKNAPAAEPAASAPADYAPSMAEESEMSTRDEGRGKAGEAKREDRKDTRTERANNAQPAKEKAWVDPNLDWGATVYLSNDDSMSLASAQRLLWAVQNKGPVQTSQVRPHELLNYFSFETDPVARGDTFSARGSAERTSNDVLTFAFAIKGVTPAREPLDLTVVLDRSGSMSAEGRMEYLKRGLTKMQDQLVRGDRVDLVLFDDQVCTPLENYVVGRDDPSLLSSAISQLQPRGSTDLDLGLKEGYRIANARTDASDRNRRMMLISDALLNTGDINPNTVSEVAKAYEESDIRLTAIGVGRDFNDKILDMLTEKGKGAYVYLGSEAVVDRVFGLGFPSLVQTIAHDVRFALDLPPSLAMKKFYGEESSTNPEDVQPIHYYAGTTQLFLQDLQLNGAPVASDPVKLTIEWKDVKTDAPRTQVFTTSVGALLESDPRNMRKARSLMAWTDMILARSMGSNPCGQPFSSWRERVDSLGEDAEIQWLDGLTSPLCGATPAVPKPIERGVAFKVKVDSDLPIAEVGLTCAGRTQTESLSSSDTVARFAAATPGGCTLILQGNVPMRANVEVPSTGGEVRCTVRGGRVNCG